MASSSSAASTSNPISQENKETEIEEEPPAVARQQVVHYRCPFNFNAYDILSIKLNGTNYEPWLTQLFSLLMNQDLLGFIYDLPPSEVVINPNQDYNASVEVLNEDYMLWRRTDLLLKGWILGSLNEDVLDTVKDLRTSRDVLTKIEQSFLPPDQWVLSEKTMILEDEVAATSNDRTRYLPLYKAALVGDWETAKKFLDENNGAETAIITPYKQNVLHVAAGTRNTHFVKELVKRFRNKDDLKSKIVNGETALSTAMLVGNTDVVKILIETNRELLSIRDYVGNLPIYSSVSEKNRDTFLYLLGESTPADFAGDTAVDLFALTVLAEFFDIALKLVNDYPHAVTNESKLITDPLAVIAGKDSSFRSGMHFNFLESFIYSCVPLKSEGRFDKPKNGGDIENPANCSKTIVNGWVHLIGVCHSLYLRLWDAMEFLVPLVKNICEKKLRHHQAIQLVRLMCEGIKCSNDESVCIRRTTGPITRAAELGVIEVIEEIVDIVPYAIFASDFSKQCILQIAVQNRCEKVFNLIHNMNGFERNTILAITDNFNNCILHLAGQLAPLHKLNLVSGAALQMQRELQWFQEVKKYVDPHHREQRNSSNETPAMVFTREHKELVIQGEKWMKDTASSCTIAASLIITIVFAAAITVPGGNNGDTGLPIFSKGSAFWLFAISDAISFFTSTTSLLMFLSILTARYTEQDFLHALPKRLILGLLTLFLSITSMIIAFAATVYLVFGDKKGWILVSLAALSCLPITSFVTLQFPLLRDVFSSTYGHGIFGKKNNRPLR